MTPNLMLDHQIDYQIDSDHADINECTLDNGCHTNANCENTDGSYIVDIPRVTGSELGLKSDKACPSTNCPAICESIEL